MNTLVTHAQTQSRRIVAAAVAAALVAIAAPAAAQAADAAPLAQDGFDRTTSSGWGTAPTGGTWSVIGGSGSSTADSAATVRDIQAGRSLRANLASVKAGDIDVSSAFKVPSASEFYFSVEGRRQSDGAAYRGRARIAANGELKTDVVRVTAAGEKVLAMDTTGMEVAPGQDVSVELEVTGTSPVTLKTRTWLSGGTVPAWAVTYTDSADNRISGAGSVGLWAYNTPGNSPISVSATEFSSSAVDTTPTPTPTSPAPDPSTSPGSPTSPAPDPSTSPGSPTTPAPSGSPSPSSSPSTPTTGSEGPVEPEVPPLPMPTRGSLPVGQATYPVAAGAVFVSTSGSDTAAGTEAAPLATVTKALSKVRSGGQVVLRGGTYREYFIVPPGKDVAIQNYPGEAVWFDGSSPVTGFKASGAHWAVSGWTTQFDSSPTYVKGEPDGTTAGWQFVNPARPMAAHPDAVWVDGVEQTQVDSTTALKPGTFYVDYAGKKLYLGSDPAGKKVEASTMAQAVSLRAPGTVLRGIGFRRFADSVWMQGVITSYYTNQTLENVVVQDPATAGIGLYKGGSTLRNVTISGAGQIGLQASYADGLVVDNLLVENANDEGFNPAPSAGGFKVTTTRGVTLKNSEIRNTTGNQFWTDQSTYDINLLNNYIHDGSRWGIVLEISSTATVAGNVVANNAFDGIAVQNTDKVNIWNNTFVGNKRAAIALTQDSRRIEQLSVSGHDKRRPQPDLTMPWVTRGTTIGNNILTGGSTNGADPILRVSSWEKVFDGNEMLASSNGNVFSQTAVGAPKYVVIWSRKGANAPSYSTMFNYTTATGQDKTSYNHLGTSPVDSSYRPVADVRARLAAVAQPLPAAVASKLGDGASSQALGAWR